MQKRNRGVAYLTTPCASRHLQVGFNQMRHGAADAAMAVTQQPAVGVERHLAVAAEISGAYPRCRFAAPGKAKFFQQHRKGDGKAVVDGCVANVRYRYPRGFFRPRDCNLRAEFAQGRSRRDMLMRMRLRAAEHTYADITGPLAAYDKGCAAVGYRTAIQQFQRRGYRFRVENVGDGDTFPELRAGMRRGVLAHQSREFSQVVLGDAVFVHVARGDK